MRIVLAVLLAVLSALTTLPAAAAAQTDARCFPETGHCISGAIRAYWEQNGGLPVFGYPIGPLATEALYQELFGEQWTGPVQWFERDRLEDHSAEGLGILTGRLGAQQLQGFVVSLIVPQPQPVKQAAPGCRLFPETQHTLCPPFRAYWENNGGLERFGYPLSEPFDMTVGSWRGRVQYFERRRMELHTELPASPVLFGLLGSEAKTGQPSNACAMPIVPELQRSVASISLRVVLGCPQATYRDVALAEEYFERGVMLYAALPGLDSDGSGRIYAVRSTPLPVQYTLYSDSWREGQPEAAGLQPPAGLLEPRRGFGKVWHENASVRDQLGWATQPEYGHRGVVQVFDNGVVVWLQDTDFLYVFGPDGMMTAFPRWR